MINREILDSLTANVIFHKGEHVKLKKMARKITKIPSTIHIPTEYLTTRERERETIEYS